LRYIKADPKKPVQQVKMSTFLFQCPTTGYKVQGYVEDFVAEDSARENTYEPVTCTLCSRVHLVNPKTGKVLGD